MLASWRRSECAYCGALFVARRSSARFCSTSCRQANYRREKVAKRVDYERERVAELEDLTGEVEILERLNKALEHQLLLKEEQLVALKKKLQVATVCNQTCQLQDALSEAQARTRARTRRERRLAAAANMQDEAES